MAQLDSYATAKLQQWLTARVDFLSPEIKLLLEQLHEFAWQIHSQGFSFAILRKQINIAAEGATSVALFELIADSMCRAIGPSERAIAMKSLQETLYICVEVSPDLSASELGRRLESYLELSGSKGLIQVFLSTHLSNLIFTDLHDSLQAPTIEEWRRRIEAIERICQKASTVAVRSLNEWPRPDRRLTTTLLLDLKAEMTRMLSDTVSLHRGA
jgi:hypothetical protein